MSQNLVVRAVRLVGEGRPYSWTFQTGVNVIVGPVGVGKTSLLELIKYGFGGNAVITKTIETVGEVVELDVDVGDRRLKLRRPLGPRGHWIEVSGDGRTIATLPVETSPGGRGVSEFLLNALGIPEVTTPTSLGRRSSTTTRVSFRDLYTYLYLDQQEIDRSIAHDVDAARDPKRRMTFEVLYGLLTTELAKLRTGKLEAERTIRQMTDLAINARQYLERLRVKTPAEIESARTLLRGEIAGVERDLALLRSGAHEVTASAEPIRLAVARAESDLEASRGDVMRLHREGEALHRVLAQLDLDLQRLMKALVAGEVFAAYEFVTCPRCSQGLDHVHREPDECRVCGQAEPSHTSGPTIEGERVRLEAQRSETESLIAANADALARAQARESESRQRVADARRRLDEATRGALSPFMDSMTSLSVRIGELRGRDAVLERTFRFANEVVTVDADVADRRMQLKSIDNRIEAEESHLEAARSRVRELSRQFDEILQGFDMPWYSAASIDDSTYLPVVNGGSMQELSSGGMKTLVSVAYYVANLAYAISGAESHLPTFLVIDSPRKNFGLGTSDREHAGLIYRRFLALQQSVMFSASRARGFQMIVADNDLPDAVARALGEDRILRLSYESPLIDDLEHPGPTVETIGGTS